jgi:signal transduction histidine kinase/iron only hydrogenase large subunit-like protein
MQKHHEPLVQSVPEVCRVCYTCVRECPAKAIRIMHGQAEIIDDRCIGCGNCVRVCSQSAKKVAGSINSVRWHLGRKREVVAIIAPSFPAEFADMDYRRLAGMVRALGFAKVVEVAAGADYVAQEYCRVLKEHPDERYIATTCPAVVSYVEYYHPGLVGNLMPVVSPMVATARLVRQRYGDCAVVFIGPCIAKKAEAADNDLPDIIEAAITFDELRTMLREAGIIAGKTMPADFDEPHAGSGRLFPLAKGLLECAGIREDLVAADVVATDGRENFVEAIKEFEQGFLEVRLLEVLCCTGCIMGAGMSRSGIPLFQRRSMVSSYVRQRRSEQSMPTVQESLPACNLARSFSVKDRRMPMPGAEKINSVLAAMGKYCIDDELNCGACGYQTCREHAVAICTGLAEQRMCLPYTIDRLNITVQKLADTNEEVASIQNALAHSEKLASMGQLAAGVAHEVNNPLAIVLMHAHLLLEKYDKADALHEDLMVIAEQADRCRRIISGLLDFARQNQTVYRSCDMARLVQDTVRSVNIGRNITVTVDNRLADPVADVDSDQIAQVLVNLVTNAEAAMPGGGTLTVTLDGDEQGVTLCVSDSGVGIPQEHLPNIFDPFFTTKQIGKGTGLGLAVLYGIVKMHRGKVTVKSNTDEKKGATGTVFSIRLPRHVQKEQ